MTTDVRACSYCHRVVFVRFTGRRWLCKVCWENELGEPMP